MGEGIHTTVFHLRDITLRIKDRLALDNNGKTAEEGMRVIDHSYLFTKAFIDTCENLSGAADDPAILPILGNNLKHIDRECIFAGHKPVLDLINANNHTLFTIRVFQELLPLFQRIILRSNTKICDHLRFRVLFVISGHHFNRCNSFSTSLFSAEHVDSMGLKISGLTLKSIKHIPPGNIHKDLFQHGGFFLFYLTEIRQRHFVFESEYAEPDNTKNKEEGSNGTDQDKDRSQHLEKDTDKFKCFTKHKSPHAKGLIRRMRAIVIRKTAISTMIARIELIVPTGRRKPTIFRKSAAAPQTPEGTENPILGSKPRNHSPIKRRKSKTHLKIIEIVILSNTYVRDYTSGAIKHTGDNMKQAPAEPSPHKRGNYGIAVRLVPLIPCQV